MLWPPKLLVIGTLALPFLPVTTLRADDWPQWRGLNRDGVCHETGLLESFPAEGLNVRWRVPVGWGFSSPAVAQGRVFLADSEVMKPKARERLQCWDATTGRSLWTHTYDVAYEDWAFDPAQEIGPVATPIVANGKVYTLGRLGHLFCLDVRNGEVLWQENLEKDYQVAFSPGMPSPLIEGESLILFIGGKPDACVVALNKDTGNEVWKALDEKLTFSSPIVIFSGGQKQLIVWTQESVTSLDPSAGTIHWRQRLLTSSDYAVSTPVYHENRLLVGGMMFQLNSDKPGATVLWPDSKATSRRIFSHTSTALFRGDHLFSAKSSGELICVEAGTGRQIWETDKVTGPKNGSSIHLTANGDSVLLYTDKGELIRARLTSQGYEEISRVAVLEPTFPFGGSKVAWTPPAYANRHIFARNGRELICASLSAPEKVQAEPRVKTTGGMTVVGSGDLLGSHLGQLRLRIRFQPRGVKQQTLQQSVQHDGGGITSIVLGENPLLPDDVAIERPGLLPLSAELGLGLLTWNDVLELAERLRTGNPDEGDREHALEIEMK